MKGKCKNCRFWRFKSSDANNQSGICENAETINQIRLMSLGLIERFVNDKRDALDIFLSQRFDGEFGCINFQKVLKINRTMKHEEAQKKSNELFDLILAKLEPGSDKARRMILFREVANLAFLISEKLSAGRVAEAVEVAENFVNKTKQRFPIGGVASHEEIISPRGKDYTEGICSDGAAILKDGYTMYGIPVDISGILGGLNKRAVNTEIEP